MDLKVKPQNTKFKGEIIVPPDKSLTHRAFIIGALTKNKINIFNFSKNADCTSTLNILKQLGVGIEFKSGTHLILDASNGFKIPRVILNCGNSGTTIRLMAGVLAGQNFNSVLAGDESLSKRPMKRVIEPLELMGAKIFSEDFKAPLKIEGQRLKAISYSSKIASAQVKSCVLLAGLNAEGETEFIEPYLSRNHTELMLEYLGAKIKCSKQNCRIEKGDLTPKDIEIAGDISTAAFFIAMALLIPKSDIILRNVGLNPTRTGILDVLKEAGADIEILNLRTVSNEAVGDLRVKYSKLKSMTIEGEIIPRLIDELPIIAILATQAEGKTIVEGATDLRNKESDRISSLINGLKAIGAKAEEKPDGFVIFGKSEIAGGVEIETFKDHRLIMSFYAAGLISQKPLIIKDFEWVNISCPEFLKLKEDLC